MAKMSSVLLMVLTNSFVVSVLSLALAFVSAEDSLVYYLSGFIGFYGAVITFWIFVLHLLSLLIGALLKQNK